MLQFLIAFFSAGVNVDILLGFLLLGLPIGPGNILVVLFQLVVNILQVPVNFLGVEIVFFAVLCPEFGAVTGDDLATDQVKVLGQLHRGTKDLFDGIGIVLPEAGNGIVIRGKVVR